jgi:N-acetylglucosaminyldiphosphoundecaprenol N-acetyl-beta-D-mannosaminyltransferase
LAKGWEAMSYSKVASEVEAQTDGILDPGAANRLAPQQVPSEGQSDTYVKESDVPAITPPLRRDDLIPFVDKGFADGLATARGEVQAEASEESSEAPKVPGTIGRCDSMEAEQLMHSSTVTWPDKFDVLGVEVSATEYDDVVRRLIAAARRRQPALATFAPVHAIVTAALDPRYRYRVNAFHVVAPDGQPIRWALNALHKTSLPERVCGPETMLRLCRRAADEGVGIYLYGSTPQTLKLLQANLEDRFPAIKIMGVESPPFRELTPEENDAAVDRINSSGAGLVFIGLGCPRQDVFAYQNRNRIKPVQLCVGAAFDFHAGKTKMAPMWMQRSGMEWVYRLKQEPRRLWKRYLVTNTAFVFLMTRRLVTGR